MLLKQHRGYPATPRPSPLSTMRKGDLYPDMDWTGNLVHHRWLVGNLVSQDFIHRYQIFQRVLEGKP